MTVLLVLSMYATVLATAAPRVLTRARWPDSSPRLAIATWLAVSTSTVLAAMLAALASSVSAAGKDGDDPIAGLLDLCILAFRSHYSGVRQPVGAISGLAFVALAGIWLAGHLTIAFVATARSTRRHAELLRPVARHDRHLDALVVDYGRPVIYSFPGRGGRIVVSSAALEQLDGDQMAAVLAHEHAHLAGRHHLILTATQALARAFPFVPLFRAAARQVGHYVELAADDAAARRHDRSLIAAALVTLADAPAAPHGALGATGTTRLTALVRVRRMLTERRPLCRTVRTAVSAIIAGALLLPFIVAANPAVAATIDRHCPIVS